MESTGKYWIPIYNVLGKDCNIVLAHPKYVKAIRGKKTDKKDAKWIADLFKRKLPLSRTPLVKVLKESWIRFSKILMILLLISNL